MAAANISRLGDINASGVAGSEYDLFLKTFSGEVMSSFRETNVFMPLHTVRTISSGKSASFPCIGNASASYHEPGKDLVIDSYIQDINHNERIIHVDQFLQSSVMVADADELMNHYDVRGPYAEALGRALAKQLDTDIISTVFAASMATANTTGGFGGKTVVGGSILDDGATLALRALDVAQAFDEQDIPAEDRYMAVRPRQYYALVDQTNLVNRDFGGANGVYSDGTVFKVAGMTLVKTNNLRFDDAAAVDDAGIRNDPFSGGSEYDYGEGIDWTNVVALCFRKSAVGTVKMQDLSVESEYILSRLGTLFVSKVMCGHGILRPEAAANIIIA